MKSFNRIAARLVSGHFDRVHASPETPTVSRKTFYHSGDYGDIIYALPTIRALGGGKLVIGPNKLWKTRLNASVDHVANLKPLLAIQPYISDIEYVHKIPSDIDFDLNRFRECLIHDNIVPSCNTKKLNLAEAHLHTFNLPLSECVDRWITVDNTESIPNRPVLIHRSPRWQSSSFPWKKVMSSHRHRALFVGLEEEYSDFTKDWGYIPYRPTSNMLELARLIAGSTLFIGNQSLPYALCEGLKHTSLLEVKQDLANCCFNRHNATYLT